MTVSPGAGVDFADHCDRCHQPIPYRAVCYMVPTGETWEAEGDPDSGKPVVEIVCAGCYTGPAIGTGPIMAVREADLG